MAQIGLGTRCYGQHLRPSGEAVTLSVKRMNPAARLFYQAVPRQTIPGVHVRFVITDYAACSHPGEHQRTRSDTDKVTARRQQRRHYFAHLLRRHMAVGTKPGDMILQRP